MPLSMAFLQEGKNAWYFIDLVVDFLFMTDVFVNSFSAYYDDDESVLVTSNR